MKISIIIAVYNQELFLEECIKSALNQTYKDIEIIVVNDGSTDNSGKILEKYSNVISIINKENGGVSSAYNMGIKSMNGEWMKTLDSDDILLPNAIEFFVNYIKSIKNSDSKIFYTNYDVINEDGEKKYEFMEPNYNDLDDFEANTLLLDHMSGVPVTRFYHKSIFKKYGFFNENIRLAEDYEFTLRLCLLYGCRLHLIPEITSKYRRHSNQATQIKLKIWQDGINKFRNEILEQLDEDLKNKYLNSLKIFQTSKYSTSTKFLVFTRDLFFKILPIPIKNKITEKITSNKLANIIYKKESSSWAKKHKN
jgi:glycosyltransferase involved in cell wall biosynthesis